MRNPSALAAAAAVLAAAGCATAHVVAGPPLPVNPAGRVPAVSPRPAAAGDTAFGLDLLRAWCRSQPRANIVFSPAGLAAGLGLAYLGARGRTAAAMARTLHLPATGRARAEAGMRARQAALGRLGGPGVTLAASNRVWSDPSLRPRPGYLAAVAVAYHAGLSRIPLTSDPARSTEIINAAISRDTHGYIPRLLAPGSLHGDAWVLTDALYLDAKWAVGFAAGQDQPGPFRTSVAATTTAAFMHGGGYRSATAGGWTAAALPYRGGRLAMTALLPRPGPGAFGCRVPPPAALRTLDTALYGPRSRAGPVAAVALPRVSLGSHQDMNGLLTRLGMGAAFGGGADFTGLSPRAGCISLVEHAATLRVGNTGTVGSAATAVGLMPSDAEMPAVRQIVFGRPYLILVTDTVTGEPLFLARVADPAG